MLGLLPMIRPKLPSLGKPRLSVVGGAETIPASVAPALSRTLEQVETQIAAFAQAFGRPPDFIDGHQHVHLFPQIRDVVLDAAQRLAPGAWVRQCVSATPLRGRLKDPKGLLIDALSRAVRRRARRLGIKTNPAFAGTYTYRPDADFAPKYPAPNPCPPDCDPKLLDRAACGSQAWTSGLRCERG